MQYVAAVCGKGNDVDIVKEQLLQSNPVLEGNSAPSYINVSNLVPRGDQSFLCS